MEPIRRLGLVRRGVFELAFAVVCLRLSSVELYLPPISVLAAPQPTAARAASLSAALPSAVASTLIAAAVADNELGRVVALALEINRAFTRGHVCEGAN